MAAQFFGYGGPTVTIAATLMNPIFVHYLYLQSAQIHTKRTLTFLLPQSNHHSALCACESECWFQNEKIIN